MSDRRLGTNPNLRDQVLRLMMIRAARAPLMYSHNQFNATSNRLRTSIKK